MEHIRQFDWCSTQPNVSFLNESDFEDSVTEKILSNRFHDPLISSESDTDEDQAPVDWAKLFQEKRNNCKERRAYVPGLRPVPHYPKKSELTPQQHHSCLKVISYENPYILESICMNRPTKNDYKTYDESKETYEKEQKAYIEWAKSMWTTNHCVRALRPKPPIETAYEARFKMIVNEFDLYPKKYAMAAQIPLNIVESSEMIHVKDLINVNTKDLPMIKCEPITKHTTIMKHCSMPEPCSKHCCRFILPTQQSTTQLPLTEIQMELAQYAAENDAQYIASESALKCIVDLDRSWHITVAVCEVLVSGGETRKVVVLGREFAVCRESVLMRTYRAFRHLLEYYLIPVSEKTKILQKNKDNKGSKGNTNSIMVDENIGSDSDDENSSLYIDEVGIQTMDINNTSKDCEKNEHIQEKQNASSSSEAEKEFDNCTCKNTYFERPPPRSYRQWRYRNTNNDESYDMIIHCAHRIRDENGEVVLEPISEYQIDLGGSEPSEDRVRSLLMSLLLRDLATLLSVRIDSVSGEVVSYEPRSWRDLAEKHALLPAAHARVSSLCAQLHNLRPGRYVLKHETAHGANAMLYVASPRGELVLPDSLGPEPDDASHLRAAPTLAPVLLPVHKFRKILPCAFSPYENQVRPPRTKPSRQKTPPQAIKWPKRNRRHKKKK